MRVCHSFVIPLLSLGLDKPNFHIVTDLYGGGDLIDYLEERVHLPEGKVQVFMNKLLSCMEYLHDSRCMVHRDLKLENILLDTDQDLSDMKLIDFGLAQHFDAKNNTFHELVGSTAYVAPQVIEGEYTAKCDIWSCGVIAYCLMAGYTPFEGMHDGETLQTILIGRFDFNDVVWDPISQEAKDFICNLLAYEENERPTAKQALAHPWLQQYRRNELDESTKDMDTSLRESVRGLRHFTSKGCKLKQAACAILASQLLKREEKESINIDFRFLNRSLCGSITRGDLQKALTDLNMDDSDYAVASIMDQVNFSDAIFSDHSMEGSNFLHSSYRMDDFSGRRAMGQSMSHIPITVPEGDEDLPDESAHTLKEPPKEEEPPKQEEPVAIVTPEEPKVAPKVPKEPKAPKKEKKKKAPVEKPKAAEPPPDPEKLSLEKLRTCYHWYMRFGYPDKKTMIRRVQKMGKEAPITVEEVEALPWMCGGAMIPVKEINKANQTNVNEAGDITNKRQSIRKIEVEDDSGEESDSDTSSSSSSSSSSIQAIDEPKKEDPVVDVKPTILKPSEVKAAQKSNKADVLKSSGYKEATKKPAVDTVHPKAVRTTSGKSGLKVSSVLNGSPTDALTTEKTIDALHSASGHKETVVRSRHAEPRKANTIFAGNKKAPDFDWKTLENTTLKIASEEERKWIKPDFEWHCIAKAEAEAEAEQAKDKEEAAKEADKGEKPIDDEEKPVDDKEKPVDVKEKPVDDKEKLIDDSIKMDEPAEQEHVEEPEEVIEEAPKEDRPDSPLAISNASSVDSPPRDKMSRSEPGGSQRRSSSLIWIPGAKSADSQKMIFPKNDRRVSTVVKPGTDRRQSTTTVPTTKPKKDGNRRVSTMN